MGRDGWQCREQVPDGESQPVVKEWLESHIKMQSEVAELLRKERAKNMTKKNMRRKEVAYKENDFVLEHKQRFPNVKMAKFGIQWHGPYRVVKVYPSAVKVRASPRLGGEILVAHAMLKRFPLEEGWEDAEEEEDDWEIVEEKDEGEDHQQHEKEEV